MNFDSHYIRYFKMWCCHNEHAEFFLAELKEIQDSFDLDDVSIDHLPDISELDLESIQSMLKELEKVETHLRSTIYFTRMEKQLYSSISQLRGQLHTTLRDKNIENLLDLTD